MKKSPIDKIVDRLVKKWNMHWLKKYFAQNKLKAPSPIAKAVLKKAKEEDAEE